MMKCRNTVLREKPDAKEYIIVLSHLYKMSKNDRKAEIVIA